MGTGKIIAIVAATVAAVAALTAGGILLYCRYQGSRNVEKVESVQNFLLRLSGMRLTSEYEIETDGDRAVLSLYYFNYASGEEQRLLEKRITLESSAVLDLLNGAELCAWDGFDGPHPRGVTDGTQFTLDATVNGTKTVHASGSQNFPKHYHELVNGLNDILRDAPESESES